MRAKKSKSDRGLFRRRGSPHWWIRYSDRHGRICRESSGTSVKRLARDILSDRRLKVAEGRHLDVKKVPKIAFNELCELYWEKQGKTLKTIGLKGSVETWKKQFGAIRAEDLTQAKIEDFLQERMTPAPEQAAAAQDTLGEAKKKKERNPWSQSTRNRHIAQMKAMFNWALARSKKMEERNEVPLVTQNPAAAIRKVDERKFRSKRYLTTDEIKRLVKACSDDLRPIVLTAIHTGMRRGELFNLKWDGVDFANRLIYVRNSKSGDPREIPMDDTLAAVLKGLPSRFKRDFVFPSPATGVRLTDIKRQFRNAIKAAKIEKFRFHDCRHTFASYLVMGGVDLKTVSELLGHSTTAMTERYAKLSPAHKTRAVKILDSAYQTDTKTDTAENEREASASK